MTQWVKELTSNSNDLSLLPRTHLVERVNRPAHVGPILCTIAMKHMHTHKLYPSALEQPVFTHSVFKNVLRYRQM